MGNYKAHRRMQPIKIAFINFEESSHEIGNHYNALIIKGNNLRDKIERKGISQDSIITENNVKILIWNARSLNDVTKRVFLADILNNNTPDIAIIIETFLLDEFNLYIKNYKTYKTRNAIKRKGVAILIHKNIIASVTQILNNIKGRYIKLSINTNAEKYYTIAGVYLEPNGDKESIPEEIYESDLIIGDMNNCDSGLNKYGIYHYKSMKIAKEISINKKISDHNILLGEANMTFKRSEIYTEIDIVNKNLVNLNSNILNEIISAQNIRKFINPHKIIKINNYYFNPKDLSRYEEWEKIKEYNRHQYEFKCNKIDKIIQSGNINKDTWLQMNKMFITHSNKELYTGDHLKNEIVAFYEDLYQSNKNRILLDNNTFLIKIADIIKILLSNYF